MTNLGRTTSTSSTGCTGQVAAAGRGVGGRYSLDGQRRDARHARGASSSTPASCCNWSSREVAAGGRRRARVLRHEGHADASPRAASRSCPTRASRPRTPIPRFTEPARGADAGAGAAHASRSRTTGTSRCATSSCRTSATSSTASSRGKAPVSDLESATASTVPATSRTSRCGSGRSCWDAAKQDVVGDAEASALLTRPYRAPVGPRAARGAGPVAEPTRRDVSLRARRPGRCGARPALGSAPAGAAAGRLWASPTRRSPSACGAGATSSAGAAPRLSRPRRFVDLCRQFGADGGQMDIAQLASTRARLPRRDQAAPRARPGSSSSCPSPARSSRTRALRRGGRASRAALGACGCAWRCSRPPLRGLRDAARRGAPSPITGADLLPRREAVDRAARLPVGIENHKDWRTEELVDLMPLGRQPLARRLRRLRQQHLVPRGPAGDGRRAGALRGHDPPQGHGGAPVRAGLRAVGGAARHGDLPAREDGRGAARPGPSCRCAWR